MSVHHNRSDKRHRSGIDLTPNIDKEIGGISSDQTKKRTLKEEQRRKKCKFTHEFYKLS